MTSSVFIHSDQTGLDYEVVYIGNYGGIVRFIWTNAAGEERNAYLPFDLLANFIGQAVIMRKMDRLAEQSPLEALGLA